MTKKTAFSLIELLVALSILAVVAAIIVPKFLNVRANAKKVVLAALQSELQGSFDKWTSLGGTLTGNDPYERVNAFLRVLITAPGGAARSITVNGSVARDSAGIFSSNVIAITNFTAVYGTVGTPTDLQPSPYAMSGIAVSDQPGKLFYNTTSFQTWYVDNETIVHFIQLDTNGKLTVSI